MLSQVTPHKTFKPWSQDVRDYIHKYLHVDTSTGQIFWKTIPRSYCKGVKAGDERKPTITGGYALLGFSLNGRQYALRVHQIVFFVANGRQATAYIDHIDRNPLNNAASNLREVSQGQNMQNSTKQVGRAGVKCTSLFKGVSRRETKKRGSVFTATIRSGVRLGMFSVERQAAEAYDLASIVLYGDYGLRNFPDSNYSPAQIDQMKTFIDSKQSAQVTH